MRTRLTWVAPILVLGLAALLRFWALDRPATLVFDELYYVRDAISQLTHGFPTVWPDSEPDMSGHRATAFTAAPANAVHPPLGKWLIGLGVLVFGPETGWGWRSAGALAGVITVGLVMRLGWLMSRSMIVATLAGFLLAIDGVHVVLSRVGLLDGFLAMFITLGALCVWRDQLSLARRATAAGTDPASPPPVVWARPWLCAAGIAFGAAAAVKWSGLYPLAAFLVLITLRDLLQRLRSRTPRPLYRATAQAAVAALLTLPLAALVYLASWIGWIVSPGGWGRTPGATWWSDLISYHRDMLTWHSTLTAPHPYQSHPLSWPLALRPTAMYEHRWAEGCPWAECVAAVSPLPNPIVTWGGVIALGVLLWFAIRATRIRRATSLIRTARHALPPQLGPARAPALPVSIGTVSLFVLVGYLSGWAPWVATFSRSAVFQFYAVVLTPFAALALALVLGVVCRVGALRGAATELAFPEPARAELRGLRAAVAILLVAALALALYFFPTWSGMPIADWFWRAHLWLPGWD